MPTYGYRCSQCAHELEVFQSMSAEPLRVCSECGGPLRKLLYPVGVHFKGSGFYSTDYKNGGPAASSKKDGDGGDSGSSESPATGAGTETKSGSSDSSSGSGSSGDSGSSSASSEKKDKKDRKAESTASKE
jgi:putative FmdB family regulatory protein